VNHRQRPKRGQVPEGRGKQVHVTRKGSTNGRGGWSLDIVGRAGPVRCGRGSSRPRVGPLHRLVLVVGDEHAGDVSRRAAAQPRGRVLAHLGVEATKGCSRQHLGSTASERASAMRWRWPPGVDGVAVGERVEATVLERSIPGIDLRLARARRLGRTAGERDILEGSCGPTGHSANTKRHGASARRRGASSRGTAPSPSRAARGRDDGSSELPSRRASSATKFHEGWPGSGCQQTRSCRSVC